MQRGTIGAGRLGAGLFRFCLPGIIFLAVITAAIPAEENQVTPGPITDDPTPRTGPRFRGRTVVLEINARIVEQDQVVTWNESHRKTTIPGRPVGIQIVGANVVVAAQFTPYIRRGAQKFLVAQGQIWMEIPDQGIRYHTSMQTIPLEFGEPIYFFPLGPLNENSSASIEVMLTLHPNEEN